MRFKNPNDIKYLTDFMKSTQVLISKKSSDEFIDFLQIHGKLIDCIDEYINKVVTVCYVFTLKESLYHQKRFLVTLDGRVFYWRTLSDKIELI